MNDMWTARTFTIFALFQNALARNRTKGDWIMLLQQLFSGHLLTVSLGYILIKVFGSGITFHECIFMLSIVASGVFLIIASGIIKYLPAIVSYLALAVFMSSTWLEAVTMAYLALLLLAMGFADYER